MMGCVSLVLDPYFGHRHKTEKDENAQKGIKSGGVMPGIPDLLTASEEFSAIVMYSSSSDRIS